MCPVLAPGTHYHANVIYSKKKRVGSLRCSALGLHHLCSRSTFFITWWATHPCILYKVRKANNCDWQACDTSPAIAKRVLKRNLELLSKFPSKGQTGLLARRFGIILTRLLLFFSVNVHLEVFVEISNSLELGGCGEDVAYP